MAKEIIKKTTENDNILYGYYHSNNNFIYHREDGPAVIHADGTQMWFINNIFVTDKVSSWLYERNIDPKNMTEEDKFALTFFMRSLQ